MPAAIEQRGDGSVLVARAPAKLNLALAVQHPEQPTATGGLHEIASWMHLIDLAGEVRVSHAAQTSPKAQPETTLNLCWADDAPQPSPLDWAAGDDLVMRAHAGLEAHAGRTLATCIEVRKRVPVGGGLGGGSSEAATALVLMNALHGLGLEPAELMRVAQSIGSDAAFFVWCGCNRSSSAVVMGTGEIIEPVASASADVVLALPRFGCPTGEVYRAFDALGSGQPFRHAEVRALAAGDVVEAMATGRLFNDLAKPAMAVRSELAEVSGALEAAIGQRVMVTGSGSTLFTLAASGRGDELGRALCVAAASMEPPVRVIATRLA